VLPHRRGQAEAAVLPNFCCLPPYSYRGADKSLVRPGRKQARKHVEDGRDFNSIETRTVVRILFLRGKAPKEIHAILTETLDCFIRGRAKDLSAPCTKRHIPEDSIFNLDLKCKSIYMGEKINKRVFCESSFLCGSKQIFFISGLGGSPTKH